MHIHYGILHISKTIGSLSTKYWFEVNVWIDVQSMSIQWALLSAIKYLVCAMMTSSNGNIFRVTGPLCGEFTGPGQFPTQRPVTRSFDVFFDLRLNKRSSKQPWGWWFETPSWTLWRQCNEYRKYNMHISASYARFFSASIIEYSVSCLAPGTFLMCSTEQIMEQL